VENRKMLEVEEVVRAAKAAQQSGAGRFCMGAAWREPSDEDMASVVEMVKAVRGLGMETCATLGMLNEKQTEQLRDAGLDYYNHNLDTSPEFYGDIISTRDYQDRLDTLERVRKAGMHVCSGGIVGMGENLTQRAGLVAQLANLEPYPESVPINNLVKVEGTPLAQTEDLDPLDFVRTIAVARITMPTARVRLSAGRQQMSDAIQALCFLAGANSIFYGEQLLTTGNPEAGRDRALLDKLGMYPFAGQP
jgi:biotin synthase